MHMTQVPTTYSRSSVMEEHVITCLNLNSFMGRNMTQQPKVDTLPVVGT